MALGEECPLGGTDVPATAWWLLAWAFAVKQVEHFAGPISISWHDHAIGLGAAVAYLHCGACSKCRERHDARKELTRWFGFDEFRPEPVGVD